MELNGVEIPEGATFATGSESGITFRKDGFYYDDLFEPEWVETDMTLELVKSGRYRFVELFWEKEND